MGVIVLLILRTRNGIGRFQVDHRAVVEGTLAAPVADQVVAVAQVDPATQGEGVATPAVVELVEVPEAAYQEVDLWAYCQRQGAHVLTVLLKPQDKDRARQIPVANWTRPCVTRL
ncbi:hypothetical protein [Ruegeria arenilitoris]|uniref:hypothetical protein n=1 Tax=Ruegeria arenilitoris TaxID=1173585 RepID=UPI001C2C1505|nr:hypothetical protein [Ruegeria arenilitoris]